MEIHPKGADMPFTVYEVGGIGGQYNLTIEDKKPRYVTLHREIPIRYTVLDGTYIGQGYFEGSIVKISPKSGELRLQAFLEPLVNIKINLVDVGEDLSHKDFYAKVLECSRNETDVYKVSFTSVPPGVDGYFQAILTQSKIA